MTRNLPTPPAWALWAMVIALPIAAPIAYLISVFGDRNPPVFYTAAEALTKSAPVGGTIRVRFETNRFRQCSVQKINRYARSLVDGFDYAVNEYSVRAEPQPQDASKIGVNVFERTFTVPTMPVGKAEHFLRLYYICSWPHVFNPIEVESPHVPFTVEPTP